MFESLLHSSYAVSYLRRAILQKQLPHALLFTGPAGDQKLLAARELAAYLLETPLDAVEKDPDFHELRPESKASFHTIDQIREMIQEVHAASFRFLGKVFVIHEADRMQPAAGNALLKTLEEPTEGTTFILLSERPQEILPTICSRCVTLSFQIETIATADTQQKLFSYLKEKLPGHQLMQELQALDAQEDLHIQADQIFSLIVMWFRDAHARELGETKHLYFPKEQEKVGYSLPSMEVVLRKVEEARLGFARNMKLSICLQKLIGGLYE